MAYAVASTLVFEAHTDNSITPSLHNWTKTQTLIVAVSFGICLLNKDGFCLSEKSGGFLLLPILQKNILFYYPKLHGSDKISILKKFTFTGLINLYVWRILHIKNKLY